MSRPEYLGCVMTANVINHIRQEQEYYDQDPERYEREQEEIREQYQMEQEEMLHQEKIEYERMMEQRQIEEESDNLPF